MVDDQALIARVQAGEAGAEEELFKLYRPRLFSAATGYLGLQHAEAEDLVHDTYMVAQPKFRRFNFNLPLNSWLQQICLRLCYARLRSRNGILRCLEDEMDQYRQHMDVERVASQNLELQNEQRLELLRELIKPLEPESRQVVQLRNVHGMTYAQIRATLNIPQPVLAQRLVRARGQIRDLLSLAA